MRRVQTTHQKLCAEAGSLRGSRSGRPKQWTDDAWEAAMGEHKEQPLRVGAAVRRRRRALELTLAVVAERSGLSVPFLSQVENNGPGPARVPSSGSPTPWAPPQSNCSRRPTRRAVSMWGARRSGRRVHSRSPYAPPGARSPPAARHGVHRRPRGGPRTPAPQRQVDVRRRRGRRGRGGGPRPPPGARRHAVPHRWGAPPVAGDQVPDTRVVVVEVADHIEAVEDRQTFGKR